METMKKSSRQSFVLALDGTASSHHKNAPPLDVLILEASTHIGSKCGSGHRACCLNEHFAFTRICLA
ncbi:hypothetical protein CSHISOI_04617 [Colletotrichum shisoi]|uniref:Uncharacterized protein n=1 Tax=Colletotrichum shisoi TaxID=2078593 RepID=A0A5Q4BWL5_9PEZI|nr:hypothetical protein CSHISOI_04617 [Colletotrichum shisoi]